MNKTITIIILIIVIILMLVFYFDPGGIVSKNIGDVIPKEVAKIHEDSVLIARQDMKRIEQREKDLISQGKQDSARYAKEDGQYRKKLAKYEKQLRAVNFDVVTSEELDSIRNIVYPPGDSAFIVAGPDPLYAMPISQARDAMEAKAREPFYDSVNSLQAKQIDSLQARLVDTEDHFKKRVLNLQDGWNQEKIVSRNNGALADRYKSEGSKQKKLRWVDRVGGAVLGFLAGRL